MSPTVKARLVLTAMIAGLCMFTGRVAGADLQEDVENILVDEGLTGIAWALIDASGKSSVGAAGLRDNRTATPFTPGTRFHVGSLTKSLLATGVLALATEGKIDLDAPALRYLPDLSFDNPWAGSSDVTVRHLLDHTAGLSDAFFWQLFSERADPDAPLIAAFPEPAKQLRLRSEPGTRFSYSNMGYTLLGMIIESVVGDRYETYLDEQLLAPLGMLDSTFAFTTQQGQDADRLLAWGHGDDGTRYAASPVFLRPAGQLTTTAADLARYAEFLLGNGAIEGQTLVDEALMRSRGKASRTGAATAGLTAGYALGMARRDRHGVVGYCHGGNIVGFVAMLCIFPDENKAFAYSVNTDSETADYGRLERLFIETIDIAEAQTPPTTELASDISEWYGRYVLSPNRFPMFAYIDTLFGTKNISADGGWIAMESPFADDCALRPTGNRLFSASDRTTTSHAFFRSDKGEYLFGDGFQSFKKVSTAYVIAHWASLLLGLAGLIWLLIAGIASLIRWRSGALRRPVIPAFVASMLLLTPVPFLMTQSFMAMGDKTLANMLLATVTLLLPIGMVVTILFVLREQRTSRFDLLNLVAAAWVLQWCAVLIAAGMLPLRLWG